MAPLRTRRRYFAVVIAALAVSAVVASSCSSSSDDALEIAYTPTQTPLPAEPTPTPEPSPTPQPEATATPAPPEGTAADVNLPQLTTNEPFTWPTNGVEQITSDAIAIAVRTVIEYLNVEQYIFNENRTEVDHTVAEWHALEPYLTPGLASATKSNREAAVQSGRFLSTWDDASDLVDFRVETPTNPADGELLVRVCIHGQGAVEANGVVETLRKTIVGNYYFDATGVLPKLDAYRPERVISETDFVQCNFDA